MARRVSTPRPRHLRVVLDDNHAARRPGAAPGWVVICSLFVGATLYAVGGLIARYYHH